MPIKDELARDMHTITLAWKDNRITSEECVRMIQELLIKYLP